MNAGAIRTVREHPASAVVVVLLALIVAWISVAQITGWTGYHEFAAGLRRIHGLAPSGRASTLTMAFPFRGHRYAVTAVVDDAQLAAERGLATEGVFNSQGAIRDAYVRTLVDDQSRGAVVAQLTAGLRRIRRELRLDDDQYVELMAAAVQAQTYGVPRWRIELPAAEVAQGRGVCSDRSVLLASMLMHEGYDTVLWVFYNEHHVAVGVRGSGSAITDPATRSWRRRARR